MIVTSYDKYSTLAHKMSIVPVCAEILGDLDTPVSTFIKATSGSYRFLFESVEGGTQRGRYSIIGDSPMALFKSKDNKSTFIDIEKKSTIQYDSDPLDILQDLLKQYTSIIQENTPFFNGGFFGYLGYDTIRHIEKLPEESQDDLNLPDIHLFIPKKIIVFDNLLSKIHFIIFTIPKENGKELYDNAVEELNRLIDTIKNNGKPQDYPASTHEKRTITQNIKEPYFHEMVEQAKKHILRGDAFQIVLSQRLTVETKVPPFNIYRALRVINPSPYMFYMELEDTCLLGSSPETLVKLEKNVVTVKPIAGTRKRGINDLEDKQQIKALLADPKERAEHSMLVDLGRNDIGRVSEYGSINIKDFMITEKYSHVIHIVSTVTGQLEKGLDAIDVFKACFPAGTVSGAPKVRAMEIIENLEPSRRSIYAGAVGYFSFNGDMDVCIAIRTIFFSNGRAYLQAGAGIVMDSIPANEYQETLNKARGLLKAIDYAEGGL